MAGKDAQDPSLGEQVRTLQAIIGYLDAKQQEVLAEQCQLRQRLADVARLAEIVVTAPGDPRAVPRHAQPARNRPKLRVIKGGMTAAVPGVLAVHRRATHVLATAVLAGAAGVTAISGPSLAPGVPFSAPLPAVHHPRDVDARDRDAPALPVAAAPLFMARRRRDHDGDERIASSPRPAPRRPGHGWHDRKRPHHAGQWEDD